MPAKSATYYMPPLLLGLSGVLAAANWYLQPDRAGLWATAAVLVGCMAVGLLIAPRWRSESAEPDAANSIRQAIFFMSLMLTIVLSTRLAIAVGLVESTDASRRMTMAVVGAFFVITGNRLPKTLTPLAALKCHPARVQSFQRFAGWTWVLTGLAFATVWLVLPLDAARLVSVILIGSGILLITAQIVRLRAARREA